MFPEDFIQYEDKRHSQGISWQKRVNENTSVTIIKTAGLEIYTVHVTKHMPDGRLVHTIKPNDTSAVTQSAEDALKAAYRLISEVELGMR